MEAPRQTDPFNEPPSDACGLGAQSQDGDAELLVRVEGLGTLFTGRS